MQKERSALVMEELTSVRGEKQIPPTDSNGNTAMRSAISPLIQIVKKKEMNNYALL